MVFFSTYPQSTHCLDRFYGCQTLVGVKDIKEKVHLKSKFHPEAIWFQNKICVSSGCYCQSTLSAITGRLEPSLHNFWGVTIFIFWNHMASEGPWVKTAIKNKNIQHCINYYKAAVTWCPKPSIKPFWRR